MKKIFLIIFLLFPTICFASDWTKADTVRELTFAALVVVDWGQTLNIADHPTKHKEYNPILGRHPSRGDVNLYMPLAIIVHGTVSYLLPQKYRKWWQYITIGTEAVTISHNFSLGIGVTF